MRRRTVLQRGAVLAALGLAGCTGGGDGDAPTDTEPPTTSPPPDTETEMPTSTPTSEPGSTPTAGSTTAGDGGDTATETATPSPTPRPSVDQEVAVGPGSLTFEPKTFEIPTGGTVRWVWESGGHNVRPSGQPGDAEWTGTEGGDGTVYDAGFTYTYTFNVAGSYEYYCAPHRSAGMTGSFTVG